MIQLPFYVDKPFGIALFAMLVSLLFAFLHWAYRNNRFRVGDVLGGYFEYKFRTAGPEEARKTGGSLLIAMIVMFGLMALVGILIGTGIIKNGNDVRPAIPL